MTVDVERLRADTPGVEHRIHLNNAGAGLMPTQVLDTVVGYLEEEAMYGGYETEERFADEISAVRTSLARLINAHQGEIALEDNATRAWDLAFYGVRLRRGDEIITTTTEYVSNLAAYHHRRDRDGVIVSVAPDTADGDVDIEAIESMISPRTALITLNHVPTSSGLVQPAAGVGEVARRHEIPFLLDACQSVGQLPIDIEVIGCDMLSATSRKYLRGPRGAGFLYVRDDFLDRLDPVFVELESVASVSPVDYELHSGAHRFETWEKSYANVLGLGTAVDYAMEIGIESTWQRLARLAATARTELSTIDGVTVRDRGSTLGGIVTFEVEGRQAIEVAELLSERGINVSISTASSSPIDMWERRIDDMVRASFHAYNSEDELEAFVAAIRAMS